MRKIRIWVICLVLGCSAALSLAALPSMGQGRGEAGGMKMRLQRVWLQDNLLWMRFRVCNKSAYDFRIGWMGLDVRQRHRMRRTAFQELRLRPLVRREPTTIPGDSTVELVYGLAPRVIGSDKELVAELREGNGERVLRVVIRSKTLLHAAREYPLRQ